MGSSSSGAASTTSSGSAGTSSGSTASSSSGGATSSSGSSGSASTSSSGASSGSSSGSSGGPSGDGGAASCIDGIQDGAETGVDCGGPCIACTPYSTGAPNTSATVQNACTSTGNVSYICPRFMLFSSEMKEAAAADATANGWPAGSFNYGVATLDGAACCSCFQLVYETPTNTAIKYSPPKPLIVQNFNQGGAPNAFDVFMGKGGEGAQTAGCSKLYSSYPTTGEPNSGGVRASNISACGMTEATLATPACLAAVTSACDQIMASSSYVQDTTQDSCIEANTDGSLYHENWNVKARQVECPAALTEVTGCKLNPGKNPAPDPTIQTGSQASSWMSYTTTTMEDCCKPSCAWPGNVTGTQSPWTAMYQCGQDGTPMAN